MARGMKRELTIHGGLMTPHSFASSTPASEARSTVTPKREGTDLTCFDHIEELQTSTESGNHGLPFHGNSAGHGQGNSEHRGLFLVKLTSDSLVYFFLFPTRPRSPDTLIVNVFPYSH